VLVWQRWNWLALAVFAVALPQWAVWLAADHSPVAIRSSSPPSAPSTAVRLSASSCAFRPRGYVLRLRCC
jgi:hypothetical protein